MRCYDAVKNIMDVEDMIETERSWRGRNFSPLSLFQLFYILLMTWIFFFITSYQLVMRLFLLPPQLQSSSSSSSSSSYVYIHLLEYINVKKLQATRNSILYEDCDDYIKVIPEMGLTNKKISRKVGIKIWMTLRHLSCKHFFLGI